MNIDLSGKTALVTGSTSGIGHAIAKGLALSGAKWWSTAARRTRSMPRSPHCQGLRPAARSRRRRRCFDGRGLRGADRTLPEVDILINNAGIFEPKGFFDIPDDDWTRFFEVNVMSGVRLARAYMPGMLKRNWGRIVFISSESGLKIPKEMIHYGMTKTAQLAVARGLAE